MATRDFSVAFRTFVNKHITSIEQIEVLLVLYQDRARLWSISELSAMLRSSPNAIGSRIESLKRSRLAQGTAASGYRYSAGGHDDDMVAVLKEQYAMRRFSVIELVFSPASGAQLFADAFRFTEEEDERNG